MLNKTLTVRAVVITGLVALSGCGSAIDRYSITCGGVLIAEQVKNITWSDRTVLFQRESFRSYSAHALKAGETCIVAVEAETKA